jgi:hypothetical protein
VRAVLLYLFLVGLPVLGLLGMLHVGQRLEAPPVLSGTWRIEQGGTCGLQVGETFEVEQSGQFLVLGLPGRPPFEGRIRGGVLRAQGGARSSATPGCAGDAVDLRLRGDGPRPARLQGIGGVTACAECPPRPIEVLRVGPPAATSTP